ncbi:MAG TPA: spore coat protein [Bacillus bacterium]|nr:spore coat protein [Bacillus sp. (in: firmicutes)]
MTIKKKLGLGVASAALGLALIGGGTWAAFNDVETLSNNIATGTLDLDITPGTTTETTFDLQNLKPGDEFTRSFTLNNNGTLAIKDVWLDVIPMNFTNGENEYVGRHGQPDNDALEFLDQFAVKVLISGVEGGANAYTLIQESDNVTLRNLAEGTGLPAGLQMNGKRLNLTPVPGKNGPEWDGIPLNPYDYEIVEFTITMIDDQEKVTDMESPVYGEYTQNVYQGDSVDLLFQFEATQWHGIIIDENGYVNENEKAHPSPQNPAEIKKNN